MSDWSNIRQSVSTSEVRHGVVLFLLSCRGCSLLFHHSFTCSLSWLSCPGLSCSGCLAQAVSLWLSCTSWPVLNFCSGCPGLAVVLQLSCSGCPVPAVLFWQFSSGCPDFSTKFHAASLPEFCRCPISDIGKKFISMSDMMSDSVPVSQLSEVLISGSKRYR
jgi:hypothetical protein